ncbi:hypothetical protein SCLCIDRAFT_795519 [Scleroderma citrinum Foug A]|uniref:Uncharacterized protein n=1 Tax=Scleroderma citrinum Foug A TaxID=1036808 RepID=A0A0C3DPN6_9AGAM|nr:hypothetical protein SCLCIDRAFT_795519 [Scleroderma citrinum Foug A]
MAAGSVNDTSWREDERHGVFEIPIEVPLRRRTRCRTSFAGHSKTRLLPRIVHAVVVNKRRHCNAHTQDQHTLSLHPLNEPSKYTQRSPLATCQIQ